MLTCIQLIVACLLLELGGAEGAAALPEGWNLLARPMLFRCSRGDSLQTKLNCQRC